MANLEHAIGYLLEQYPHKYDLSNARVTKMLYLADWYNAINKKPRVTNLRWYFDNYGPFVWDVRKTVADSPHMTIKPDTTMFGEPKELFLLSDRNFRPVLSRDDRDAIDYVIKQTQNLGWSSFIQLVYSTYPVASSSRYSYLNLERLANEYLKSEKAN
jgi:hypothetical protein